MTYRLFFVLLALTAVMPCEAFAYCEGGLYPNISVENEIRQSDFIVIGTVTNRMIVVDPKVDPEGYEAEIYHIKIDDVLHGKPPAFTVTQYLSIFNVNTSSRFPMDIGGRYVLFVYSGADGYWVNDCGHSGVLSQSLEIVKSIKNARKGLR